MRYIQIQTDKIMLTRLQIIPILFVIIVSIRSSYADEVFNKITERITKTKITEGTFQQEKRLRFLKKPLISGGKFIYEQYKGVLWKTEKPIESAVLIRESQLITAQGGQALPLAFGGVFKSLLGGDVARLNADFEVNGTEQKGAWGIRLIPKDEMMKKVIGEIRLRGDTEIRQWELQETGGNLTRIDFTRISHPNALTEEQQAEFERFLP